MKAYRITRIICIILLMIIIFGNIFNIVEASSAISLYNGLANDDETGQGISETRKIIGRIITIVQLFGVSISVIMLIILGMKYMIASAGDKAEIKKHLTTYVVGAVVLFGSAGILEIVKNFFIDVTG
ncbi:MAG: hypothetical protein ACI4UE_05280 [Candidatus Scatovivens sp.]